VVVDHRTDLVGLSLDQLLALNELLGGTLDVLVQLLKDRLLESPVLADLDSGRLRLSGDDLVQLLGELTVGTTELLVLGAEVAMLLVVTTAVVLLVVTTAVVALVVLLVVLAAVVLLVVLASMAALVVLLVVLASMAALVVLLVVLATMVLLVVLATMTALVVLAVATSVLSAVAANSALNLAVKLASVLPELSSEAAQVVLLMSVGTATMTAVGTASVTATVSTGMTASVTATTAVGTASLSVSTTMGTASLSVGATTGTASLAVMTASLSVFATTATVDLGLRLSINRNFRRSISLKKRAFRSHLKSIGIGEANLNDCLAGCLETESHVGYTHEEEDCKQGVLENLHLYREK
jgi:hypothetical protein